MEALSVIFSLKKKISFTSFAEIRNYFNFNEETNIGKVEVIKYHIIQIYC